MTYRTIKLSGWEIKLAEDFPSAFESVKACCAQLPDGQRSSFVKLPSSKFAKVFKFNVYLKGKIYSLILKQYLNRSLLDILKNILRPCRAQRAYEAGLMLNQHGFSSPDIAATGKKTFAGITAKNFLITGEVKNAVPLYKMLVPLETTNQKCLTPINGSSIKDRLSLTGLDTDTSQKQQLIGQFGQTVGRMHAQNIFHGDLRLGNVLVKKEGNRFVFIFLDNERTRKFEKLPQRHRLKNLVQVFMLRESLTDDDKTCFLTSYLAQQQTPIDKDKLAKEVASKTAKRLAEKEITANKKE